MKRRLAATLTAGATALLLLAGCSGPQTALGQSLETDLWASSEFEDGTVSITAESLEPVSKETMTSWELTSATSTRTLPGSPSSGRRHLGAAA